MKIDSTKKFRVSAGLRVGAFVLLAVIVVSLGLMLSNVTVSLLGGTQTPVGPTKDMLRIMSH